MLNPNGILVSPLKEYQHSPSPEQMELHHLKDHMISSVENSQQRPTKQTYVNNTKNTKSKNRKHVIPLQIIYSTETGY